MNEKVILLVEDNPDDEELSLRTLRKSKVANRIVVARDGAQALDYVFAQGRYKGRDDAETPLLVLLDLNLPKLSGLEVLRQIRSDERTKLLPVVLLISSKEDQLQLASQTGAADGYAVKPVDFAQLSEAVRQLGLSWLIVNQLPPKPPDP